MYLCLKSCYSIPVSLFSSLHLKPTMSTTIVIPNFFSHFALEQAFLDENKSDFLLEYEDSDLIREFR